MKRLIVRDTLNNRKACLSIKGKEVLTSEFRGPEKPEYVLTCSHRDSHTHPVLYPLFFGALEPVMLNETTDKAEILDKLRKKEGDGPIVAYEYKLTAGLTARDLEEFGRDVWLVDSSFHSGVASRRLLNKISERKGTFMFGEFSSKMISEDYNFLAMAIMEEQAREKGIARAVKWMKARIAEGTTSMDEKLVMTETGWDIFKAASKEVKNELGYQPIRSVYVSHNIFIRNPKKYADEAGELGIPLGVKWIADGGLGSKTAALEHYSYSDGSKGQLTLPVDIRDIQNAGDYAMMLRYSGIRRLACHAIGDLAIGIMLNAVPEFRNAGIDVSLEHFELPTRSQIDTAAAMGLPLSLQPNYSTEVWRYAPWLGEAATSINPLKTLLNAYSKNGAEDRIRFGTDGMPQSMLWAIACGVNHPLGKERISIGEAVRHSRDPGGIMVLKNETYERLQEPTLKKDSESREASAARLHDGVVLVARYKRILHTVF
ncbi:hypothetical protein GF318_05035 [Candidatus Micrarchaeota archaeon]|nr:hypothetical protein [Candidatus Micrarchaeota archaeon]